MAETVFIVPGLAESALSIAPSGNNPGTLIYPDIPGFLLGSFGAMRLAADGVSPGPPDGLALVSPGVLGPWVGNPTAQLQLRARSAGFNLVNWNWDWRKSIFAAGDALAAEIVAATPAGSQSSIVGHSAGGLVARRAWSTLGATGQQHLIRRIVTLGTPHYGSYSVVNAWSAGETFVRTLWSWNSWAGQTIPGITFLSDYVGWSLSQVIALSQTWPSLYEILPMLDAPDAGTDPNRIDLYTAANWGGISPPSQAWLDYARTVFQPWALGSASQPPENILISVAGGYRETPSGLVDVTRLGTPSALGETSDGDDTVTRASAQLVGSTTYRVTPDHSSLYANACQNGDLLEWLTVSLPPTPPPNPEQFETSPIAVVLDDPPYAPNPPGIAAHRVPSQMC